MTTSHNVRAPQTSPRTLVLVASVRKARLGNLIGDWVADLARTKGPVDVVDLATVELPDDALLEPGGGPLTPLTGRIAAADAFVVVTPEYNHSYPAGLKRAIDWHFHEWRAKAATVVSYGVNGGLLATEHLRGVFAELNVVTTRRAVGLRTPWLDVDEGAFQPPDGSAAAVDAALDELAWWATTLREARAARPFPA